MWEGWLFEIKEKKKKSFRKRQCIRAVESVNELCVLVQIIWPLSSISSTTEQGKLYLLKGLLWILIHVKKIRTMPDSKFSVNVSYYPVFAKVKISFVKDQHSQIIYESCLQEKRVEFGFCNNSTLLTIYSGLNYGLRSVLFGSVIIILVWLILNTYFNTGKYRTLLAESVLL